MNAQKISLLLSALVLTTALGACDSTPKPDYRVKLVPAPGGKGMVAIPPECPSWTDVANSPNQNDPWPQFGCAHARNLAAMVERPEDLIEPKKLGDADANWAAGTVDRYRAGKAKALIDPNAQAPVYIPVTPSGMK